MPEILALMGFILALVMAGTAMYCWKKALTFHTLLVESAHRFEALKQSAFHTEKEGKKILAKYEQTKEALQKAEKQLSSGKNKLEQEAKALSEQVSSLEETNRQLELKLDHLKPQVDALTTQLRESENSLREAQTKNSYLANETERKVAAGKEELVSKNTSLKSRCIELEQKLNALKAETAQQKRLTPSEEDFEKLRSMARKGMHSENLYRSMRGLREMADERNRNWEVALQKFASWILTQKKSRTDVKTTALGPLVGEALNLIGERLVDDEFSERPEAKFVAPSSTIPSHDGISK